VAYWVSPWQLAQCPHCLYRFHPSDAHLRPTRGNGPLVNDEGVEWFLERRVSLPAALDPAKDRTRWQRWLSRLRVVSQTAAGYDHLCPRCHLPISLASATGQIPTAALAIIGEKGAGKSTYLGMLIRQLLDGDHASIAGFSVTPQDSFDVNRMQRVSSRDLWQCRYADVMFEQRRLLEGTPLGGGQPDLPHSADPAAAAVVRLASAVGALPVRHRRGRFIRRSPRRPLLSVPTPRCRACCS
jgi:hypothetical protein